MRKIVLLFFMSIISVVVAKAQESSVATDATATVERLQVVVTDGVVIDMVYIPAGTFMMGATAEQGADAVDDEKPVHEVSLSDYYIATTECTQALWEAVMGYNTADVQGADLPMTQINVYECHEFVRKLSKKTGYDFRLPTEAEWEYAARGGALSKGTKYSGSNNLSEVAWCAVDGMELRPVAGKKPNELGLYDMSGNVYEICEDEYAMYSAEPQDNPQGGSSDRQVFRGGGYISSPVDCRTSMRSCAPTDYRDAFIGFRLVINQ